MSNVIIIKRRRDVVEEEDGFTFRGDEALAQ
jgi:hypothetical protein